MAPALHLLCLWELCADCNRVREYDGTGSRPIASSFLLRKWYADCVAADGRVWIGYWGEVRWRSLRLRFVSSALYAEGRFAVQTSLRAGEEPRLDGDRLTFSAPAIDVDATLTARSASFEATLHQGVTWRCHIPSAEAVVRVPGATVRGDGYAEVLELTVPPWRLPIRELWWGRAVNASTSLVWIRWSGGHELQLAVRNGLACEVVAIEDHEVLFADGLRLGISEQTALRDETLAATLKPLRPLAPLLPRALTAARERKWRSRGTLFHDDQRIDEAWVIHERVTFGFD